MTEQYEIRASDAAIRMKAAQLEETVASLTSSALSGPDGVKFRFMNWSEIQPDLLERYAGLLGVTPDFLREKGVEALVAKDVPLVVKRAQELRDRRQTSYDDFNPYL